MGKRMRRRTKKENIREEEENGKKRRTKRRGKEGRKGGRGMHNRILIRVNKGVIRTISAWLDSYSPATKEKRRMPSSIFAVLIYPYLMELETGERKSICYSLHHRAV